MELFNVEKFINKYNDILHNFSNEEAINFIKKRIITDYVEYSKKIAECKEIIKNSNYKTIELNGHEKTIYYKNTPNQYFSFICRLIINYTDIDILQDNVVVNYDLLNKSGLLTIILSAIPETELSEWTRLLEMIDSDEYENNRSLVSYIDNKLDALELTSETIIQTLDQVLKDNN